MKLRRGCSRRQIGGWQDGSRITNPPIPEAGFGDGRLANEVTGDRRIDQASVLWIVFWIDVHGDPMSRLGAGQYQCRIG